MANPPTVAAQVQRSYDAFLRDLPNLLSTNAGQWAAYAGDVRVGIGRSRRMLYRDCLAAGYRDGEFVVCGIEPPQSPELSDLLEV
jgi:hypothetical protein